ncbi:hypothetical protein LCGC14_1972540, partial [marine sediment metagenome]
GTYTYVFTIYDVGGNFAMDTVIVNVSDGTTPILTHPTDITYNEGDAGNEIAWTANDLNPATYSITKDGTDIRGPFSYNIPVTNGTYSVRLYFAEIYWGVQNPQGFEGDEGRRIFNTTIEDVEVFTGYDLVKDINPAIADQRMYDIEVTDGILTITFEASVNKPKISAIEVLGTGTVGM